MIFKNLINGAKQHWCHLAGFFVLLWFLLRSGSNPKRLTYPCQQISMPIAANWLLWAAAFVTGSLFLKKFFRMSGVLVFSLGILLFVGTQSENSRPSSNLRGSLPVWIVDNPVSTVIVMDSLPPTSGSLAPGDSSVPDEYLTDPAMDTLLMILAEHEVYLHQTSSHPNGIVGADNVVIIKGNYQWNSQNTTNTDRVKGLIWQILQHPDGFTGEIIVCDNTQMIGTTIDENDNNSEDSLQSLPDVVNTFFAKGYQVYYLDWNYVWDVVVDEYQDGDYDDGYTYDPVTKINYPKFQSPSENYYISLKYGIWDFTGADYDSSRLCIIDFPVLKSHSAAGATIAIKNWIGVVTTAYSTERYGGSGSMHYNYFFAPYALVARVMAVTFPRLTIVDAAWTTTWGPNNLDWIEQTNMLAASTDPVAISWYTAKFILTPIARYPNQADPDYAGSYYNTYLGRWTAFLHDSAGFPCTMDSSEISVYDRGEIPATLDYMPGDANMATGLWPPQVIGSDVTYLVNYFREAVPPCMLNGFYCSGDANGDCQVIGSDVTRMVSYFRGLSAISYCQNYEPAWLVPEDLPVDPPAGWPNCEIVTSGRILPTTFTDE